MEQMEKVEEFERRIRRKLELFNDALISGKSIFLLKSIQYEIRALESQKRAYYFKSLMNGRGIY